MKVPDGSHVRLTVASIVSSPGALGSKDKNRSRFTFERDMPIGK